MLNEVRLIGFLGKDPETRYMQDGKAVTHFSLATSESWKDKEGKKGEKTEWHNIVIFGKLAETAEEYLKKGSLVHMKGSIKTRSYDKEGETRYVTEIVVDSMIMLPNGKGVTAQESAPAKSSTTSKKPIDKPAARQTFDGPF